MPYPSEHAARIKSPGNYGKFRRVNNHYGDGIHCIYGIKDGKSEVQSIRFDKDKFSVSEAKKWLKEYEPKYISFEPAMKKAISSTGSGSSHVSSGWKKKPKRKKPAKKPKGKSGGKSMKLRKNYTALIKNVNQEQRIVSGPVLVPEEIDKQKDIVSEEEIVKAAHGFMKDYQNINVMHSSKYDEFTKDIVPVESVVLKHDVDFYGNGETLKKGTWILDVYIGNDEIWSLIKDGKIKGYSVEGEAKREEIV